MKKNKQNGINILETNEYFNKEKTESILSDFKTAYLYEEDFLKDLKEGLKKSSVYKIGNNI